MLRFLEAGLVATVRQLAAIIVVTLIGILLVSQDIMIPGTSASGSDPSDLCGFSRFLRWTSLLTAIGLVLTQDRSVAATADRIRHAAPLVDPKHGSVALAVQLVVCSILLALFALRAPPLLPTETVQYFGPVYVASIAWTVTISIGVALLGASAHAAIRAL